MKDPDWYICRGCKKPDFIGHAYGCTHTLFREPYTWKPDKPVARGWQDRNSHFHFEGAE